MVLKKGDYYPIGIFDSGYGGLTVLKEIVKELPEYDYLYLGDNARAPYGSRSFETVYEYTLQAVKYLFAQGCPLVLLACNTASAKALRTIQQKDLPVIAPKNRVLGVIRPTSEIVGKFTKTKKIGLFGTAGTVSSDSYVVEIEKFFPEVKLFQQACPLWVPMIENNEISNEGADFFIKKYCKELLKKSGKIDTIILACTHYPLIEKKIKKHLPENIKLISQGNIVAKSLNDYLQRHPEMSHRCSKQGSIKFLTTDSPETFNNAAKLIYNKKVEAEQVGL